MIYSLLVEKLYKEDGNERSYNTPVSLEYFMVGTAQLPNPNGLTVLL
jgi:hypothetical protein